MLPHPVSSNILKVRDVMRKLSSIALVGVAIVLAAASPSYAVAGHGGHGFSGHSAGGNVSGHHGFIRHHRFFRPHNFHPRGHSGGIMRHPLFFFPLTKPPPAPGTPPLLRIPYF